MKPGCTGAPAASVVRGPRPTRQRRLPLLLVLAAAAGVLAVVLGIVVFWPTQHGLVRLESDDPDVAIVFLRQYLQFHEGGSPTELEARPTLIADKRDGTWQIVLLQNTRITEAGGPSKEA